MFCCFVDGNLRFWFHLANNFGMRYIPNRNFHFGVPSFLLFMNLNDLKMNIYFLEQCWRTQNLRRLLSFIHLCDLYSGHGVVWADAITSDPKSFNWLASLLWYATHSTQVAMNESSGILYMVPNSMFLSSKWAVQSVYIYNVYSPFIH